MKKIVLLVLIVLCIIRPCHATDHTGNNLLSMMGLTPETATRNTVTALMGAPHRVQENKKSTSWFYTLGSTQVVINWSKKTESLLRFSFKTMLDAKSAFDNSLPYQLKSGTTNLTEALNILGTPQDATIKGKTQEMHYNYKEKVLRLFFRDRVLVDYCLY